MDSHGENCKCHHTASSVQQTLTEMEFERGIWNAAISNEIDRIKDFIKNGKTMERDNFGYTALHYAARNGNEEICRLLIEMGNANVDAVTNGGATALHRAAMKGHLNIAKLLVESGANLLIQDENGQTALHRSSANGHMNVSKYLIQQNGQLKGIKDKKGNIPFDILPANANDDLKMLLKL